MARAAMAWSRRVTVREGSSSRSTPKPRRIERTWPMTAAAAVSCPVTSPMTRQVAPSGLRKASYQSPPTWSRSLEGR